MSYTEQPAEGGQTVKVEALSPQSRQVNVSVKIVQKGEIRETFSRSDGAPHRVSDVLVGDETGAVYMSLWDDNIEKVNEGDSIDIKNGYVSLFRGSMRLNIGRYGKFEPAATPVGDVNTENNLSNKMYEQERRSFGGGGFRGGGYGRGGGGGGGYGGGRRGGRRF